MMKLPLSPSARKFAQGALLMLAPLAGIAAESLAPSLDPSCGLPRLLLRGSQAGTGYAIRSSDQVGPDAAWQTLLQVSGGQDLSWTDAGGSGHPHRFYRVDRLASEVSPPVDNFALVDHAGVKHEIGQAEVTRAVESPAQAVVTFGSSGGVAEAAGSLDGGGRRVVFAGEAEHGAAHAKASGLGGAGQIVAFVPRGMMRVAARDLHDIDAEAVHQGLEFGDAGDLQRPATDADGERFEGHGLLRGLINAI